MSDNGAEIIIQKIKCGNFSKPSSEYNPPIYNPPPNDSYE